MELPLLLCYITFNWYQTSVIDYFHYYVNEFGTYMNFSSKFFRFLISDNEHNAVTLQHTAQRKHAFFVKTKEKSKAKKLILRRKVSLRLLHQKLGHRSTRLILAGNTAHFWQDIELRVDPDLFFTSCHISTINKKDIPKTPLKSKTPFKWVFMGIILAISSIILRKDNIFSN